MKPPRPNTTDQMTPPVALAIRNARHGMRFNPARNAANIRNSATKRPRNTALAPFLDPSISGPKLEQNLSAAIRFQRLLERFLELLERVDMLHCGGERPISYEVAQLLVNLLNLCSGRVAYPVDEPESVEAKTMEDEVSGRDGWELPTLHGVDDNRAASLERFGQLSHGRSAHRIEDETKFLPVESLFNIFV